MTNLEFVKKLKHIVNTYRTVYMWGAFGSPVLDSFIKSKSRQYPSWYTQLRQNFLRGLIGKGYFAFDCVNLIKAILWGWNGDASKPHGGAVYKANRVPDINADTMFKGCYEISKDFTKIEIGEAVWIKGHIGIYIGEGKVIEATPSWANGVQVTACLNIGAIKNLKGRLWDSHGKLAYIEYVEEIPEYVRILKEKTEMPDAWLNFIGENKNHPLGKWLPELIVKIAK